MKHENLEKYADIQWAILPPASDLENAFIDLAGAAQAVLDIHVHEHGQEPMNTPEIALLIFAIRQWHDSGFLVDEGAERAKVIMSAFGYEIVEDDDPDEVRDAQ